MLRDLWEGGRGDVVNNMKKSGLTSRENEMGRARTNSEGHRNTSQGVVFCKNFKKIVDVLLSHPYHRNTMPSETVLSPDNKEFIEIKIKVKTILYFFI